MRRPPTKFTNHDRSPKQSSGDRLLEAHAQDNALEKLLFDISRHIT